MAFTIPNKKKKKNILSRNQKIPGTRVNGQILSGGNQPPKNKMVHIAHISTTLTYSPRKKSKNGVDEYSTKNPATSSASASTRSNGGRLVSASAETKKIGSIGNRIEKANQPCSCARTMADRFSEPANSSTVMITKPIETSYDTIWAAARIAERNGYFEFEAQPAMMMP